MYKSLLTLTILANLFSNSHGRINDKNTIIKTLADAFNARHQAGGNITNDTGPSDVIAKTIENLTYKKCSVHEKFTPCPEFLCLPQICEHVGFPQCNSHEERYYYLKESGKKCDGPPACVCIENYVRNENGVCINVRECPSCGSDKNATVGCGMNCNRRCSNYKRKGVQCADICYVNRCECKKGYVFDDYTGVCVLPKDCSKQNIPNDNDETSEQTSANDKGRPREVDPSKSCDNCGTDCDAPAQGGNKWKMPNKMNDNKSNKESQCISVDSQRIENNKSSVVSANKIDGENPKVKTENDDEHCWKYNDENECDKISNNSTTSCKGDPNAMPGCDKKCIKRCPGDKSNKCKCPTDSCECKEGYVFNSNTFKCITPDECGDKVSNNSTTSCKGDPNALPGCDKKCIKRCPGDKPNKCSCPTDSCECKEGYVYNSNTFKCTKPDECGDKMSNDDSTTSCKGDPNAMSGCDKNCIKRCPGDKSNKCSCPTDSCECKEGYVFNSNTFKCTKPDECGEKSANSSTPVLDSMIQDTCEIESLKLYLKADLAFTAKILQEITQENYGSNLVVGGSSILYLLGQLQLFAVKGTAKQIQKALNLNNQQVACFLPKFYENITKPQYTIEYDAVTTIIADKNCPFTDKFKRRLQKVFHTQPFQYDFSNPLSARMINDMIAMRTNNNIKNFITSDVLSSLTNLILVDTQSFGGEWQNKFDSKDTTEMEFHGANSRITKKQTMFQSGKFLYTNNLSLGCKVLKINYKSSEFSMVIFLPHFANGVSGLVKKLSSVENVLKALTNLRKVNVDIYLPRFQVSSASRLKFPVLKANVNRIFNASNAGLQRVASCTTPFVSGILQKIILTVNENGGGNADDNNLDDNDSIATKSKDTERFQQQGF